jgi:D-alanine-D-alanine ligase
VSAAGVAAALARCGHDVTRLECDRTLPARLLQGELDVVFPVVHGAIGEDGSLQGLLELLSMPYVGAGVLASALANDKVQAKVCFRAAGLPVADELVLAREAATIDEHARTAVARIGRAIVIKPATQGSALGVTLLPDLASDGDPRLVEALDRAFALDAKVLVESFRVGREVTCGVLHLEELEIALPPTEIHPKAAGWYDFQSRYGSGGSQHTCPAKLHEKTIARVQEVAVAAHRALGARDLSRADFVVGPGDAEAEVTLLEVNTMPGFTRTSLFPEAAGVHGVPFDALCDRLVRKAVARGVRKFGAPQPFPS